MATDLRDELNAIAGDGLGGIEAEARFIWELANDPKAMKKSAHRIGERARAAADKLRALAARPALAGEVAMPKLPKPDRLSTTAYHAFLRGDGGQGTDVYSTAAVQAIQLEAYAAGMAAGGDARAAAAVAQAPNSSESPNSSFRVAKAGVPFAYAADLYPGEADPSPHTMYVLNPGEMIPPGCTALYLGPQQAGVPEGWQLVPRKLDDGMSTAYWRAVVAPENGLLADRTKAQARWDAMLDVAPQPQAAVVKDCLTADEQPQGEGKGEADDIVAAYMTWPDDLRAKLSLHDLRRMSGWAPRPNPADWGIDTSAGRPILVLNGCSVIEAEDARYVLALIQADQHAKPAADAEALSLDSVTAVIRQYGEQCIAVGKDLERAQAFMLAGIRHDAEPLAADVIALAKEREDGYRNREHGDVVNGRVADKLVELARRLAGKGEGNHG